MAYKKETFEIKLAKWFNSIQPYLLLIFIISFVLCVVISTGHFAKDFLPYPAAEPADRVQPLFNTTTILTGIAFFVTQILLFFFAFRYRTKPKRQARFLKNNLKLEIAWIAVPFLTFMFLFVWGQIVWAKVMSQPKDALELEVMGAQFSWRVRYPGKDRKLGKFAFRLIGEGNEMGIDVSDPNSRDDFIPIQMHVPKGTPVKLSLRSRDVIHSFFIPYLRVKMDAVPGMVTHIHFTPTVTTTEMRKKLNDPNFNYEVACAELCGRMHFAMKLILVVDEPEEFEAWYNAQKTWIEDRNENMNHI